MIVEQMKNRYLMNSNYTMFHKAKIL